MAAGVPYPNRRRLRFGWCAHLGTEADLPADRLHVPSKKNVALAWTLPQAALHARALLPERPLIVPFLAPIRVIFFPNVTGGREAYCSNAHSETAKLVRFIFFIFSSQPHLADFINLHTGSYTFPQIVSMSIHEAQVTAYARARLYACAHACA